MRIARLDVDEGFLDGLSIDFAPGLNVLIGARGTGKTSILEILRFVLGAPWFTTDAEARSRQQVLSVLGNGLAKVTLVGDSGEIVVMRGARDEEPRSTGPIPTVTVLAQNEMEAVGAQAAGRLGLVDRFVVPSEDRNEAARQIIATLRSIGKESHELRQTEYRLRERVDEYGDVDAELAAAVAEQHAVLENVEATREDQEKLEQLRSRTAALVGRREILSAALDTIAGMEAAVVQAVQAVRQLPHASGEDGDPLADARLHVGTVEISLLSASEAAAKARNAVVSSQQHVEARQVEVDGEARQLSSSLDSLHNGLGQVTRRVDELREKQAHRDALREQIVDVRHRLEVSAARRRQAFLSLEQLRTDRHTERLHVTEWLSRDLAPHVRIEVRRSAATAAFATAIVELLKGSGIHYNKLAAPLARSVSPLELVEAVEQRQPRRLAEAVEIPLDRAEAVVAYLFDQDLTELLVAPIEDVVDISLLDGADYKSATEVSIGQRCTAVLPILLRSRSDILIVDQPEDHLDNAFISGALVQTLRDRSPEAQFIFASHNANIPVLGDADRIVLMESDGKRGYARHQGALDEEASVNAVTDVMEGGREAFRRRAAFYASHSD